MGATASTNPVEANLKIEFFKWSSSQFPEELAFIYTLHSDRCCTSTFWVRANRSKVLCTVVDSMCKRHPVRVDVEFNTVRDYMTGHLKIGEITVHKYGEVEERESSPYRRIFYYLCSDRFGDEILVYERNSGSTANWVVGHNLSTASASLSEGLRRLRSDPSKKTLLDWDPLNCHVNIQCDQSKGLCVDFHGPSRRKTMYDDKEWVPVRIDRQVRREPPAVKALTAIVKSGEEEEEEEEEEEGISQEKDGMQNLRGSILSAKGLVNSVGGWTKGHFNGSVFSHCQINATHHG